MSKKSFQPHYKVFTNSENFVKVGCSYAGRMYYGSAKCSPEDEFDYDFGYKLAKARCDRNIAAAKVMRSRNKIEYYRHSAEFFQNALESEIEFERKLYSQWLETYHDLETLSKGVVTD